MLSRWDPCAKSLDGIIATVKEELGIDADVEIKRSMILSRIGRNKLVNVMPHPVTPSPMLKGEPIMVQLCIRYFQTTCQLSTQELVDYKIGKYQAELAAESKNNDNAAKRRAALHKRVHAVQNRTNSSDEWTVAEFGAMLVYHKSKKDPKVALLGA